MQSTWLNDGCNYWHLISAAKQSSHIRAQDRSVWRAYATDVEASRGDAADYDDKNTLSDRCEVNQSFNERQLTVTADFIK